MPEHEAENAVNYVEATYPDEVALDSAGAEIADEELMARYARGDSAAFEEIYRRYRGPVFRFMLRSVRGDRATAEDLFHDVMMKVVGAAERYKPSAKFSTWLFRIARNTCIDAARRKKFEPSGKYLADPASPDSENLTVEDVIGDMKDNPEDAATDTQTRDALTALLAELNPDQREVFLLREVEGLSFQEVANIAGCTESTAKSRMRYAISYLAKGLKERGIER